MQLLNVLGREDGVLGSDVLGEDALEFFVFDISLAHQDLF